MTTKNNQQLKLPTTLNNQQLKVQDYQQQTAIKSSGLLRTNRN